MKKILFTLLIVVMTTMLFACQIPFLNLEGSENTGNNGEDNTQAPPPSEYTVTFETNAGYEIDPVVVKPGELCKKPYDPTKRGYKFSAWYYDDIKWNFATNKVNDNITLKAVYTPIDYTISYTLSGGTATQPLPTTYTVENDTIVLPALTREGCTFAGWYSNGKLITEIPKGTTGNYVLVADFYGPNATVQNDSTASVRTWDNVNNIEVKLTASTDEALTVTVDVTKPWSIVKVVQGNSKRYLEVQTDGDKRVLDIEMIPNANNVFITPIVLEGSDTVTSDFGVILANGKKVDKNYYPGFVRKSVTFTIDDGNLTLDEKFISIVKPAGISGTFNLINTSASTAAKYLMLYEGFEVANHHQLHCLPWLDGFDFSTVEIKNEIFNSSTADVNYMYITKTPGLYYIDYKKIASSSKSPYWHPVATDETYTKYIDITKEDIESLFGEGSVVGFAYPHGALNEAVKQYLKDAGYLYARKTGVLGNKTGFALPEDRFAWTYNANVSNLNDCMAEYDALKDDGTLKFFSFGVHAVDFDGQWYVLESFAKNYGNRPEDFWYATNREIFEYEDAVNALEIYDDKIVNPTDVDVFVTIDNVKTIIYANSIYEFED